MYNHNVFAVLTSIDKQNNAKNAFYLSQNAKWLRKANKGVVEMLIIDNQQSISITGSFMNEISDVTDCFVLIFDELSKDFSNEMQFGTNSRSSHVFLKHWKTQKISAKQYNIIVNNELRIWLRVYLTHRIVVAYNNQNKTEFRKIRFRFFVFSLIFLIYSKNHNSFRAFCYSNHVF